MIAWLTALAGCVRAPAAPPGPDVIVLTVDTLRADRLGFAGEPAAHTPVLDGLAARGRVFSQATTPFPRTTPGLGALHTGLRPVHHGSREVGQPVRSDDRLAARFASAGWRTVAAVASAVAGPDQRLDLGFDAFVLDHDAPAQRITARALDAVGEVAASDALFLWVHYADPHFPYDPPGALHSECLAMGRRIAAAKARSDAFHAGTDGRAAAMRDDCVALYDGEVTAVDRAVGDLLTGLDAARGDRPRWLVVTADHGENLGEGGLYYEHGPDVDDASVRIPLVITGPGVVPGADAGVARLEDLLPTLLDVAGVERVPGDVSLDGASLAPRLRGEPGEVPLYAAIESGSALRIGFTRYLVAGGAAKWCVNGGPASRLAWCAVGRRRGLFDPVADPQLVTELSARYPDDAARLEAAAARWGPPNPRPHQLRIRAVDAALDALPTLDGWQVQAHGAAADPDVAARLTPALDALRAEATGGAAGDGAGDAGATEALRALGYVE